MRQPELIATHNLFVASRQEIQNALDLQKSYT